MAVVRDSEDPAVFGLKEVSDPGLHDIAFITLSRPAPGRMISRFCRSSRVEGCAVSAFSSVHDHIHSILDLRGDLRLRLWVAGEPVRLALVEVMGPARSMILKAVS